MANKLIKDRVIGAEVAAWKLHFNLATLEMFRYNEIHQKKLGGDGFMAFKINTRRLLLGMSAMPSITGTRGVIHQNYRVL